MWSTLVCHDDNVEYVRDSTYHNVGGLRLSRPGSRHHRHTSSAVVYSDPCDTGSYWLHTCGGPLGTNGERLKAWKSWYNKGASQTTALKPFDRLCYDSNCNTNT